ncbi:MAG: type II toxin-antitoxin system VapC family toxin [Nitrospirae bacterium]|nr:type II toxin-antitoxin system VapC family toxin [Nitrospirota bacterium]MBI3352163.1 type II toxin-antitoxin system VapC family toxin [Nitrospirota bacterium]
MTYLDTSALIKRYIQESGTELILALFENNFEILTSKIAYAEVYSALTRRMREQDLPKARYLEVCRLFEREWPAYIIVELNNDILHLTRDLIKKYPLRSFDAIHLASAKFIKNRLKTAMTFGCADHRLLQCAKKEKFDLLAV